MPNFVGRPQEVMPVELNLRLGGAECPCGVEARSDVFLQNNGWLIWLIMINGEIMVNNGEIMVNNGEIMVNNGWLI